MPIACLGLGVLSFGWKSAAKNFAGGEFPLRPTAPSAAPRLGIRRRLLRLLKGRPLARDPVGPAAGQSPLCQSQPDDRSAGNIGEKPLKTPVLPAPLPRDAPRDRASSQRPTPVAVAGRVEVEVGGRCAVAGRAACSLAAATPAARPAASSPGTVSASCYAIDLTRD